MKIGVFGDSFASHSGPELTWWKYLAHTHGHEVESFGEPGSSIIFSAKKILDYHQTFDFIIWCVTGSNRITVWHKANYREIAVHVTGRHHVSHQDLEIQNKIDVTERYLREAFDWDDGSFVGNCVIEYVQQRVPNLLKIPCFIDPIYSNTDVGFNLFELCQREADVYFDGLPLADIYDDFLDLRPAHLTESTHKILAELINKSLSAGIFQTDYKKFPAPQESFDKNFRNKSR